MSEFLVVMITAPEGEAESLARSLVEEKLAACVNVVPGVRSIFRWEGTVTEEGEALLLVKTSSSIYSRLEQRVKQLHSYDVPEIVAIDTARIAPGYREFLMGALSLGQD